MPTIVTTQTEFDAAIAAGAAEIEIRSEPGVWLTIGDTRDSDVTVAGESQISACSGRVEWVTGSGRVGRVTDSGRVGRVTGSGRVEWVTGSGRVEWVTGTGSVERATGTATVHLHGHSTLGKASPHVAVFLHSATATYHGGHLIDLTSLDMSDPATWAEHHGADVDDTGHVSLYKAVRDDLRSAHGFDYPIGEIVACDDWRDDNQCGNGLHFSLTPQDARDYDTQATRYLECRVALADLRPLDQGGSPKCKAPAAVVVREVDLFGEPVETQSVTAAR